MVRGRYWLELADNISLYLQPGQPLYVLLYASAISSSVSSTRRWFSTRVKQQITEEVRCICTRNSSGRANGEVFDKVMTRLTLVGALYITFIC